MPLSLTDRDPRLVARIDTAYELADNHADVACDIGALSLSHLVEDDILVKQEQKAAHFVGLESIVNPDTRKEFTLSLLQSQSLFNRIGVPVPEEQSFVNEGVNFAKLGSAYEQMVQKHLMPSIVLAPTLTPDTWEDLFYDLRMYQLVKPTGGRHSELHIDDAIKGRWAKLSCLPTSIPVITTHSSIVELQWSLRLIAGTSAPTANLVRYTNPMYRNKPTVNEYLSLQAGLYHTGQPLVEAETKTFLSHSIVDNYVPIGTSATDNSDIRLEESSSYVLSESSGMRTPRIE